MVHGSIRDKLRSNVLKELARERATKRTRAEVEKSDSDRDEDEEEEEQEKLKKERYMAQAKCRNHSLLTILPSPKNSNAFGPSVKLEKLLKMPERANEASADDKQKLDQDPICGLIGDDTMIEVDVSKIVGETNQTLIKELTVEKTISNVIVPKGKEKQKNQITYLAQLGKATELERKEQAAQSRLNKSAARSKYGW